MTNQERWLAYVEHLFSPDILKSIGWYFCVAAALERRVWLGRLDGHPLFPNLYVLLVGEAACGKSLIISAVRSIIGWPRRKKPDNVSDEEWNSIVAVGGDALFPTGADATSYEALIQSIANATRTTKIEINGEEKIYFHASIYFTLSELKSLLKMHNKVGPERKIGDFLLQTYDCEDYRYVLKHQPPDIIRNSCVSLLAGAVPSVIHRAAESDIFEDGLASRCLFVYPDEVKVGDFFLERETDEQLEYRDILRRRVIELSELSGEVKIDKEAVEFMNKWWETDHLQEVRRASSKYASYLGRRRVTITKLAMAIHFSDSNTMTLTKEDFQKAIEVARPIEASMKKVFSRTGSNPKMPKMEEILNLVTKMRRLSLIELYSYMQGDMDYKELTETVSELVETGQLLTDGTYYTKGQNDN